MSYAVQLKRAAEWLGSVRNEDNGWGLAAGQGSSIVNTSEAIYVLSKVSGVNYHTLITDALRFIQTKTLASVRKNPRTRYIFFALLACLEHLERVDESFIDECTKWLLRAKNNDGAWGHVANDENSRLYPTAMSLLVLHRLGVREPLSGYHWIISQMDGDGWRFSDQGQSSSIATALAVVTLRTLKDVDDQIFIKPKEQLLTVSSWGVETEDMPGTPWIHCSYMWIFPALIQLGLEPYSKTIAQGVRELNKLNSKNGWKEPNNHLTVRGQFWATVAFHNVQQAFDPAVHTYRIDSALSVSEMQEPGFVSIRPHSKLSLVVPRVVYQTTTYVLLLLSILTFFGIHRLAQVIPRKAELFFSLGSFVVTYFFVRKRRTLFPSWILKSLIWVVGLLSSIDLLFGVSVTDLFNYVTQLLDAVSLK